VIYLDHNATTPVLPEVFEAMKPYLIELWGNPSSSYRFGSELKGAIETARAQVAMLIGSRTNEIVFTGNATESNNAAIHAALKANPRKKHIITSQVEHSSVLNYCMALEKEGHHVTYLPVDREGLLDLGDLERAISEHTAVVSLMWANNETGVLFPVADIANHCKSRNVLFHCDAVQAAGKVPVDVSKLPIDYLSITGHKFGAPKGIGALYVQRKAPFSPYLHGGHQERGYRGGTENVALIVGLGRAAELAKAKIPETEGAVRPLRDALENGILSGVPGAERNGHKSERLANTSSIAFRGVDSDALLMLLDQEGLCASSGSACLADSPDASHVITAMKPELRGERNTVRLSLGMEHTATAVSEALRIIKAAVAGLRSL
jgi:cysteine desulfurase